MILGLIGFLGFTLVQISGSHLRTLTQYTQREKAYQLANSALEANLHRVKQALDFYNDPDPATFPKLEKANGTTKEILQAILEPDGSLKASGASFEFDQALPASILESEDGRVVKAELILYPVRPLYTSALVGFHADSGEVECTLALKVTSNSSAGNLAIGDSIVKLSAFTTLRRVNLLLPALSKFVLMIQNRGALIENRIAQPSDETSVNEYPLQILSHKKVDPLSLGKTEIQTFLDSMPLVYLGGLDAWTIQEGFSAFENQGSSFLQRDLKLQVIPGDDQLSSKGFLSYFVHEEGFSSRLTEPEYNKAMAAHPDFATPASSILQFGGSAEEIHPIPVIGPVNRRYALLQGIYNTAKDKFFYLPYLGPSEFSSTSWPSGDSSAKIQALKDNFDGSFERYKARMSTLHTIPYNRWQMRLLDLGSDEANSILHLDPEKLPTEPPIEAPPNSKILQSDGLEVSFFGQISGSSYSLKNDEGAAIFSGSDLSTVNDLSWLKQKAGNMYDSWDRALYYLGDSDSKLHIGGVIYISGEMILESPLTVPRGSGGMILVEKDISIRSSLEVEDSEPLTLVSLNGDVKIETPQKLEMGVVALDGSINLPDSLDLRGFVIARELKIQNSLVPKQRQIKYNRKMDPTNAQNFRRQYRLMVQQNWTRYVP